MHKRLLIIFGIIATVVLLAVLLYIIFAVGNVNVNTTNNITLTEQQKSDIIKLSGIKGGNNIFAIDEDIAIQNIEISFPKIKVLSIERKFPNNVYIYVTDRTGVFSLLLPDRRYAVLDRELKVIDIVTENDQKLCQLEGVDTQNVKIGYVLEKSETLLNMIKGAEKCSFINARFYSFIKKTEVKEEEIWLTTNTGVVFCLPISSNIDESMINCYGYYLEHTNEISKSGGKIVLISEGEKKGWTWVEN